MSFFELIVISIGLGMDAFAIAICKGLSLKKVSFSNLLTVGFYFGGFQALMPVIGYLLGFGFREKIQFIDHWVTLILLVVIGFNMIKESFNDEMVDDSFDFKTMFLLSIATSLDALAVGVTFAFLDVSLIIAVILIGFITFALSVLGVKIGNLFGSKYRRISCVLGGIILIVLGIRIFLEHLGIIIF